MLKQCDSALYQEVVLAYYVGNSVSSGSLVEDITENIRRPNLILWTHYRERVLFQLLRNFGC